MRARSKFIERLTRRRVLELRERVQTVLDVQQKLIICFAIAATVAAMAFVFSSAAIGLVALVLCSVFVFIYSLTIGKLTHLRDRETLYQRLLDYIGRSQKQNGDCPFAWKRIMMNYNFLEDNPLDKDVLEHSEPIQSIAKDHS